MKPWLACAVASTGVVVVAGGTYQLVQAAGFRAQAMWSVIVLVALAGINFPLYAPLKVRA